MNWGWWALGSLAVLAAALAVSLLAYQALSTRRDRRRYPPLGRLVPVGDCRLHIHCIGEAVPTVVLEAGLPATCLSWWYVQRAVAAFARVASYDRAGLGWSDPGPNPRTTRRIIEELHTLLDRAGIPPPYVLVGHSFGGFTARLYTATYPEEVVGMVLVDSLLPEEWWPPSAEQYRQLAAAARRARRTGHLAQFALFRLYLGLISRSLVRPQVRSDWVETFKKLPRELLPVLQAFWSQPKPFYALASQLESLPDSARQVAEAGDRLGELPLVVLSAGNATSVRRLAHESLARSSTRGRHLVATASGHWIQLDQPELVVAAIRSVVEAARQHARMVTGLVQ